MIKMVYFSTGKPKTIKLDGGKEMVSGIAKERTEEAYLSRDGFKGDGVADTRHHGGRDRAVCIYPHEHYAFWEREFGVTLPASAFGENLTVTGMTEGDVHIGDIYRVGEALIQVTQSRVPCSTISRRLGIPKILPRIIDTGFTGYLCRVIEEGMVRHDSDVRRIHIHPAGITVQEANDAYFRKYSDRTAVERVLSVRELALKWREGLEKRAGLLKGQ
ncbi:MULTISPECIES: MOSC domain-containing protein [Bhargavaea]|uniref:MOSC domain-containing protein n=1 Tax=Bhargavaea changchunensis TaxID=2134037 RepID=A0ABW2NC51_9BACL|nr:MOSC domain-containing protein [Bhargavaea sp. CC-171006]